jgi:hypothetical protein
MINLSEKIDAYVERCSETNKKGVRECLENPYRIIERMRAYVLHEAKKKKLEPWSIVGNITGNGSGYSSAIWEVLIKDTEE